MASKIVSVRGRRVWDSRGRPTVEAEVRLAGGASGRAIAPAGASTGTAEALDLRDKDDRFAGFGVSRAVDNVNGPIADALIGLDGEDQLSVDEAMIKLDGTPIRSRLGGNAMIAVSMAVAHAASSVRSLPLWKSLAGENVPWIPVPEIQIFGGGAHAGGRVDLQDFMVVPYAAGSFSEATEWVAEIYACAARLLGSARSGVADEGGFWPISASSEKTIETLLSAIRGAGFDPEKQVGLSLDVAATQLFDGQDYVLKAEGRRLKTRDWFNLLVRWTDQFPVLSIEDPFEENDFESHAHFTELVGDSIQVVGDDLLATNLGRIERAARRRSCNTLLCKPNQAGTLSEARKAFEAALSAGWETIISARSGESEDVTIVHLALGWGVRQLKVGSFSRSERMAKWNEMLRIEESLGAQARFAGQEIFPTRP